MYALVQHDMDDAASAHPGVGILLGCISRADVDFENEEHGLSPLAWDHVIGSV